MQEIYNLGISENTIKNMIEINPNIVNITEKEISDKIKLLKSVGCTDNQVTNIISSNALYLDRTNEEVVKLIKYLLEIGFNTLNILFDSNPYILNLEAFEIEKYINDRKNKGELIEDIIDDLDSNTYLFNEL